MQCLNPIIAHCDSERLKSLKRGFIYANGKKYNPIKIIGNMINLGNKFGNSYVIDLLHQDGIITLPCRKCSSCQLNRSREWAIRNSLEAKNYDDNEKLFLTLTYDDEHLPLFDYRLGKDNINNRVLSVADVQTFLKCLRKKYNKYKIRFYACGEFGSKTYRPHYHLLLYGLPIEAIDDLDLLYTAKNNKYYNSETISNLWFRGNILISSFSDYTAMYTARYCTKKYSENNSLMNRTYYNCQREFNTMSRRPGIGANYFFDNKDNIYCNDEFIFHIDNKSFSLKPLSFFDRLYDVENPIHYKFIKENRKKFYKCSDYFDSLDTDITIAEYLRNQDVLNNKMLNSRRSYNA